jgi:hypothetical protein
LLAKSLPTLFDRFASVVQVGPDHGPSSMILLGLKLGCPALIFELAGQKGDLLVLQGLFLV